MDHNNNNGHGISDEERFRVTLQVDHFIEILERRSGIEFAEIVSLLQWAREHKNFSGRLSFYASLSIIGIAISGIAYGLLEGIKHIFGNGK